MRFLSYGGLLRRVRRHADLSQRELAKKAGVDKSVISRIEAGRQFPTLVTFEKLLEATGFALQAVSADGQHVVDKAATWVDQHQARDGAYRRFPAHLDVRRPTKARRWWYEWHTCADIKPPLLTFELNRGLRDAYRLQDGRTACDPDERNIYARKQSWVHIPGYRPKSQYGGGTAFW